MPSYKRARSSSARVTPYALSSARKGSGRYGTKRVRGTVGARATMRSALARANQAAAGVVRLNRMIETKEMTISGTVNQAISHNNIYLFQRPGSIVWNPFESTPAAAGDPMDRNNANRIGDNIAVKGLAIKCMFENALGRSKVWYRLVLVKCSKGDTPTRANVLKGDSTNVMLDQINTERFTIVKQQIFSIATTNGAPTGVAASGVPNANTGAGPGSKLINWWIPGSRFGKYGTVQYENGSNAQVKFFDYRLICFAYDWYGTPQDINDVGRVNDMFSKLYFKDA